MLIFFNEFRKISTVSSSCIKIQVLYVIYDEGRKGRKERGREGVGREEGKGREKERKRQL